LFSGGGFVVVMFVEFLVKLLDVSNSLVNDVLESLVLIAACVVHLLDVLQLGEFSSQVFEFLESLLL